MEQSHVKGVVFDIQRFSISDGPGIRTTVFLKGCNLKCLWCHNPESQHLDQEIQFFANRCIGCGKCIEVCPYGAHEVRNGERIFRRGLCRKCGRCVESCYAGALVMAGRQMTVEEVLNEVMKDRDLYRISNGGVTFSGGEPLLQTEFLKALLIECKNQGLHTAVDTAGHVAWKEFEAVMPYVDLFLFDIKVVDEQTHIKATGVGNHRILENLRKLAWSSEIWIRVPIVPGINDSEKEMEDIALILNRLEGVKLIELLPYHRLGENKYASLGREFTRFEVPSDKHMSRLADVLKRRGFEVNCKVAGNKEE